MAPVTVLVALVIGIPSTVRDASVPVAARVKKLDELPESGLRLKSLALPELLLTNATRAPVESVTTLAVTPSLSPLM